MRRIVLLDPRGGRFDVEVAVSWRERALGLLGRDVLDPGAALLLPYARSVHSFGMRFDMTVALLDRGYRVIDVRHLPAGRLVLPRRGVRHILECAANADLRKGDVLTESPGSVELKTGDRPAEQSAHERE